MYGGALLMLALALWAWFIAMAEAIAGYIGALIALAGPIVVGYLLWYEFWRK
jgi:hypothetical protein